MNFKLVKSINDFGDFINDFGQESILSVDTETDSLDPFTSTLLLLQIKVKDNIYLFDCRSLGKEFISYLISLIKDADKLCIFHNAKFDLKTLYTHTGELLTNIYDTMLAETLLYQGLGRVFYSLHDLVKKYCKVELDKSERSSFIDFKGELTQEQLIYSALDVLYLKDVMNSQTRELEASHQSKVLELENKLNPVVANMELDGVLIDKEYWMGLSRTAQERATDLEASLTNHIFSRLNKDKYPSVYDLATALNIPVKTKKLTTELKGLNLEFGNPWLLENFNVGSSNQMKSALAEIGVFVENTNEKTLAELPFKDEAIDLLLAFREQNKRVSTYGEEYMNHFHSKTGRIHAEFNQLGTYTGRFSASNPCLHQIPREQVYRHAFIARPGYSIITSDFNQQELRLAGGISGEPAIINAYKNKVDMHRLTGSIIHAISLDDVTKEQRSKGKSVNFAVLYGSTEYGLAYNLRIPIDEARALLSNFWKGYPVLSTFKTYAEEQIRENYFSTTPLGRRRYFEKKTLFQDPKEMTRYYKRMMREGFNHIIQGSGSDVTKFSMCNIFYNNPFGDKLRILMQVHDELVCEVADDIQEEGYQFIKESMEDAERPFLGEIEALADGHIDRYWTKE